MKRFVVSDVHGQYVSLLQVLAKANFNKDTDLLISLGDIVDRGPQSYQVVNFFMNLPNKKMIWGNHDVYYWNWLTNNVGEHMFKIDGISDIDKKKHLAFLKTFKKYLVLDNKMFVHGGAQNPSAIAKASLDDLVWDRTIFDTVIKYRKKNKKKFSTAPYSEVFVGHTPTVSFSDKETLPINYNNFHLMDTGASWGYKLSVMDIDSHEVFQSDEINSKSKRKSKKRK